MEEIQSSDEEDIEEEEEVCTSFSIYDKENTEEPQHIPPEIEGLFFLKKLIDIKKFYVIQLANIKI